LWLHITSAKSGSHQTIPFFEALAVLDQIETNKEINAHLILQDDDFKKNMWLWAYTASFVESTWHLNDYIVVQYGSRRYHYKAWYLDKNKERIKYMKKKWHQGIQLEQPLWLKIINTDIYYLYYITQDLGMRYSYLYNLQDKSPLYLHGELVYSYLWNSIFLTYDHELPYEFILLNSQERLATKELWWFLRNMFADGRYIYMQVDDFQWHTYINIYDAKNISWLHKIPFGFNDTARIGFKKSKNQMTIEWYVINKLYLYIKFYDLNNKLTYLKKFDLLTQQEIASLLM
jgi:hypothetical protein